MRLISLLLILSISACSQKHKTDPQAKLLSDSAIKIYFHAYGDTLKLKTGLSLLDRATEIDSNYWKGYFNKAMFLDTLHYYDRELKTLWDLVRIKPEDPYSYLYIGNFHERVNRDTIASNKYYTTALSHFNIILDTMNVKNKDYEYLLFEKGGLLVRLHRNKEGIDLFKKLYNTTTDKNLKELLPDYINPIKK